MGASRRSHIRSVELKKIIVAVLKIQRGRFLSGPESTLQCKSPVTPYIERSTADLVRKGRSYQESVEYVQGTSHMEETVRS